MRTHHRRARSAPDVARRWSRAPSEERLCICALALAALPVALLSPSAIQAQEERDRAPEVVAIRFDWPVGLRAGVTANRERERETGGKISGYNIGSEYRFVVSEHEPACGSARPTSESRSFSSDAGFADFFARPPVVFISLRRQVADTVRTRRRRLGELFWRHEPGRTERSFYGER